MDNERTITVNQLFMHQYTPPSNDKYTQAYRGLVKDCADRVSSDVADAFLHKLKLYREKPDGTSEEVKKHDLLDLLWSPSRDMSPFDFYRLSELNCRLYGYNFWQTDIGRPSKPTTLKVLYSQYVEFIKPAKQSVELLGVKYGQDRYEQDVTITPNKLIICRNYKPDDLLGGIGSVESAWDYIQVMEHYWSWVKKFLSTEKPIALLVPEETNDGDYDRVSTRINEKFVEFANQILLLSNKYKLEQIDWPSFDQGLNSILVEAKKGICTSFGMSLGLIENDPSSTDDNQADNVKWSHSLRSRLRDWEAVLNHNLVPLYDKSLWFEFDDVVLEDRKQKLEEITKLGEKHVYTINEMRQQYGLEPHPQGDIFFDYVQGTIGDLSKPDDTKSVGEVVPPAPPVTSSLDVAREVMAICKSIASKEIPLATGLALIKSSFPDFANPEAILEPLIDWNPNPEPVVVEPVVEVEPEPVDESPIVTKAYPKNDGLRQAIEGVFEKAAKHYLDQLDDAKASFPESWIPLPESYTTELVDAARPEYQLLVETGGNNLIETILQDVGFDADRLVVTNPKVQKAIDDATFAFADSTLATATSDLAVALETLREVLGQGLDDGDRLKTLKEKIEAIFSSDQAGTIAQTETIRAFNIGTREYALETDGIVGRFDWLVSSQPCDKCVAIKERFPDGIPVDGNFGSQSDYGVGGSNPAYETILAPPCHPHCVCTLIPVLA